MLILDGGIILPLPKRVKGFTKPDDVSQRRWDKDLKERWTRAYTHCLYSLHLLFELPLHSIVPRISKKMLEATDSFNISLRFIGEMEASGYLKFSRGMDSRVVTPTKKLLELNLGVNLAPETAVVMPKLNGEWISKSPIRGGVSSLQNKKIAQITRPMSQEKFVVNKFIYSVLQTCPPDFTKAGSEYMFKRMITSAETLMDEEFRFPYFLDSRSRLYVSTTCGLTPQGADHEKAIILPTHSEVLTEDGYAALLEATMGYAEKDLPLRAIVAYAEDPKAHEEDWKALDKPYSFLACADLIRRYIADPSQPLPAFIPLDGRCSGLQHWSAVTRSNTITKHLGMHKEEAELDIYEKVAEDWKLTLPEEHWCFATRKAAKIPVMTWGYNATMMTSMEHMSKLFGAKTVWDNDLAEYKVVGEGLERAVSGRLGADLYRRLNETLGPLRAAVDWVSDCATEISKIGNTEIHWLTPDGFEAMQRKVKGERLDIKCILSSGKKLSLQILDFTKEVPNTAKHRSAIAPNIIHGCDATHLRMVAERLEAKRLPMVFIHDSFSTHCNHRKTLYNDIIETFIGLYSGNYLVDLKDYWEVKYGVDLVDPPEQGDWEPDQLKNLKRFFL